MKKIIVGLFVIMLASVAHASGGEWAVNAESCTTYTGGCTATGQRWGRTLPQCDNATDGTFICHTWMPNFCASPEITIKKVIFENLSGIAGTGNNCLTGKFASETDDSDADEADITFGTATSQIVKNIDTCDTNDDKSICVTGASDAQAPKNLATGSNCSGTACNSLPLKMQVLHDTDAGCATPSTDDVNYIGFILGCE